MPEITVKEQPRPQDEEEEYELACLMNYRAALSGPAGEFVLRDLCNLCLVGESAFLQAEYDPIRAAFLEGRRSVALRLLRYSGHQPFGM